MGYLYVTDQMEPRMFLIKKGLAELEEMPKGQPFMRGKDVQNIGKDV